jgi:hypothetical protein
MSVVDYSVPPERIKPKMPAKLVQLVKRGGSYFHGEESVMCSKLENVLGIPPQDEGAILEIEVSGVYVQQDRKRLL